jgi:hypothetical protein
MAVDSMASEEALQPQLIVPFSQLFDFSQLWIDFSQLWIFSAPTRSCIQSAFWGSPRIPLFDIPVSRTIQQHGDQISECAMYSRGGSRGG